MSDGQTREEWYALAQKALAERDKAWSELDAMKADRDAAIRCRDTYQATATTFREERDSTRALLREARGYVHFCAVRNGPNVSQVTIDLLHRIDAATGAAGEDKPCPE